ncbi:AAA domain-containing protein [Nitrosomonas ureae]|uniref:AAA domain-containing protein n=1 Tax=Nitrosomonas ureae TaxID=44577 RepID=A0A285BZ98_9PROT|nr:AAA family ATPase [Nitrosomonas ureae]SNX60631.1 AAA domain-containing protein [Nitrosomonas ureae]
MSKTLTEIAQQLKDAKKKVQLIYAFNGTGKTRLSREFKDLIAPKTDTEDVQQSELAQKKILYYSAFTEDLFYWDNDLRLDVEPKLRIHTNVFTRWVLEEQGQDQNIIAIFQHYTNEKLTPRFNSDFSAVSFSFERGNIEQEANIKISKGEESNFIWSVFHSLIEQMISELNIAEAADRSTDAFNNLEYVFIDDPVSSLDENHLIELAVDLAQLIKSNESDIKFIITTHNPLFYNVLHNELKSSGKYRMKKLDDGTYELINQSDDSPFSYHLFLKLELEKAIESGQVSKYHFNFLRNILEKTSTFLGYQNWGDLLPKTDDGRPNPYEARIINISSHSKHAGEEVAELTEDDKRVLAYLVRQISEMYRFDSRSS